MDNTKRDDSNESSRFVLSTCFFRKSKHKFIENINLRNAVIAGKWVMTFYLYLINNNWESKIRFLSNEALYDWLDGLYDRSEILYNRRKGSVINNGKPRSAAY